MVGARSLSVIAATPRALSLILHQPRRTRAGALLPAGGPLPCGKGTTDRKNLAWAYREFSMTSDSGACLFPEGETDSFADAAPVLLPFRSTLLARRGSKTRASSTSRCRMGDDPNAETFERSITVCPFSPLRAFARRRSPEQPIREDYLREEGLREKADAREAIRSRERAGSVVRTTNPEVRASTSS